MKYAAYVVLMVVLGLAVCIGSNALFAGGGGGKGKKGDADKKEEPPIAKDLKKVLPPFSNLPWEDQVTVDGKLFFRAKGGKKVKAVASIVEEQGYGGLIAMAVGVKCNGEIFGVEILKHMETEGFGAKATDPKWRAQFKGKKLSTGAWKVKKDDPKGIVDEITGATITSRAVTKGVEGLLQVFDKNKETLCK